MWVLWLVCALLLVIAVLVLIRPLFRTYSENELSQNEKQANRRKDLNIELYEQKKAQLEQDIANGLLDEEARIQAQNEIEHSLIQDAEVAETAQLVQLSQSSARKLSIAFLLFIPLFSIATYVFIKPDNFQQIVLRQERPMQPDGQQAPDIGKMVASLENKLKENPNNLQGWNMLGRSYVVMERYSDAVNAYEKALALSKEQQGEHAPELLTDLKINYVEVLMQTAEKPNYIKAKSILDELLSANPDNGDALWFMGFLDYEAGNKALTVEHWSHLMSLLPPESEQAQIVKTYLSRVIAELPDGHPAKTANAQANLTQKQAEPVPQATGPAPGQQLTGSQEEQAFIASMIARVEARVKENPQDVKGWKSLGKSYGVLKRYTDSANAYAKAVAIDNKDIDLLMDYVNAVILTGQTNQLDNARIVFAQLLDKNPENLDALFLSGSLARAAGDTEDARLLWNKLLPLLDKGSAAYISVENNLKSLQP